MDFDVLVFGDVAGFEIVSQEYGITFDCDVESGCFTGIKTQYLTRRRQLTRSELTSLS